MSKHHHHEAYRVNFPTQTRTARVQRDRSWLVRELDSDTEVNAK
jgi:hypothetical protein